MKKILALLLATTMGLTNLVPAFAATSLDEFYSSTTSNEPHSEKVLVEHEVETITDDEGNIYEIEMNWYRNIKDVDARGIFPEHEVGYVDTFEFKVTNNQLGVVGLVGGTPVSDKVKDKIAELVAKKLSAKIGASLLPGINIASWIIGGIATINSIYGNTGFIATVECEYSSVFIHSQGHDMYGWDLKKIYLGTY